MLETMRARRDAITAAPNEVLYTSSHTDAWDNVRRRATRNDGWTATD